MSILKLVLNRKLLVHSNPNWKLKYGVLAVGKGLVITQK